jgi:hypothetical protein
VRTLAALVIPVLIMGCAGPVSTSRPAVPVPGYRYLTDLSDGTQAQRYGTANQRWSLP